MKGLKVRATAQIAKLYQKLGATPVFIPMPATYEALERHTVEGASAGLWHMKALHFYEVAKNLYMIVDIGVSNAGFGTINLDAWNAISKKDQEIIQEVSNEYPAYLSQRMIPGEAEILTAFKAAGVTVNYMSDADKETLKAAGEAVTKKWAEDMDAKGLPGTQILNEFLKSLAKYAKVVKTKGYPWQ